MTHACARLRRKSCAAPHVRAIGSASRSHGSPKRLQLASRRRVLPGARLAPDQDLPAARPARSHASVSPDAIHASRRHPMKPRILVLLAATVASANAFAGSNALLDDLSQETGLSPREIRLVLGPHPGFEKFLAFRTLERAFVRGVGEDRYEALRIAWREPAAQEDTPRLAQVEAAPAVAAN
jgi:hypothetical protein